METLDGSGIYSRDSILGKEERPGSVRVVSVPQIEEIRAIRGQDGEDYINLNDVETALNMMKYSFPSMSAFLLVREFINKVKAARREP